jgi:demethylmenaquinone methyltransferase/2-methoxy-6-polyprenyl-1,4-benzoquinol methylase
MAKFDHFDFLAPLYDWVIHPREPEMLRSLIDFNGCGLVLDAGGGTGRISQFLCNAQRDVVIVDLSFRMLQKAVEKKNLDVICAPIEKLPFRDGAFSCIIMVDALHHVIDQSATAAELWRVLGKDGRLIIEEPDIEKLAVKMIALAEKMALMRSHFLKAEVIAGFYENLDAKISIERAANNCWIVVDKI